jgi:hypothetical protein
MDTSRSAMSAVALGARTRARHDTNAIDDELDVGAYCARDPRLCTIIASQGTKMTGPSGAWGVMQ